MRVVRPALHEITDNVRDTPEQDLSAVNRLVRFPGICQHFQDRVAQNRIHSVIEEAVHAKHHQDNVKRLNEILKVKRHKSEKGPRDDEHVNHFGALRCIRSVAPRRHTDETGQGRQRVDQAGLVRFVLEIRLEKDGTEGVEGVLLEEGEKVENFGTTQQCIVSGTIWEGSRVIFLNYSHTTDHSDRGVIRMEFNGRARERESEEIAL